MHNFNASLFLSLTLLSSPAVFLDWVDRTNVPRDQSVSGIDSGPRTSAQVLSTSSPTSNHAYHHHPPRHPLSPILAPSQFTNNKAAFVAYALAARIPDLLYQEPCMCGCDRQAGHKSLLNCFTTRHGQNCFTCQLEVYFCFEQHQKNSKASDVRKGLIRGDYSTIDGEKYAQRKYEELAPPKR
jgi:hypothetical protein